MRKAAKWMLAADHAELSNYKIKVQAKAVTASRRTLNLVAKIEIAPDQVTNDGADSAAS